MIPVVRPCEIDWRWRDLVLAGLLSLVFMVPLTLVTLPFLLESRWHQVILGVILEAAAVLPAVLVVSRHRGVKHLHQFGLGRYAWKKALFLGLAGGLGLFALLQGYGSLVEALGIHLDQQKLLSETLLAQRTMGRLFLFLLVVVLVAPLWEEIFFRGLTYAIARRRLGPLAGGLLSALFFAVLHAEPLPLRFPVFLLGLLLAALYERTNSLYVPIIAHGIANMLSTILAYTGTLG